jgi:hypothetical protein
MAEAVLARGTVVIDVTDEINASRSASSTLTDRRRPGRADYRNTPLIALMRGHPVTEATAADTAAAPALASGGTRHEDGLGESRGILNAMLIGVTMWAAMIFALAHFV